MCCGVCRTEQQHSIELAFAWPVQPDVKPSIISFPIFRIQQGDCRTYIEVVCSAQSPRANIHNRKEQQRTHGRTRRPRHRRSLVNPPSPHCRILCATHAQKNNKNTNTLILTKPPINISPPPPSPSHPDVPKYKHDRREQES